MDIYYEMKDHQRWAEETSKITTKEDLISYFLNYCSDLDEATRYYQFIDDIDSDFTAKIINNIRRDV
jgi:hypothetical protein